MAVAGNYVDGFLLAVPEEKKEEYLVTARLFGRVMKEKYGLIDYVETWSDDVPEGKVNSFHTAVMREEGEAIIFAFSVWPDKATRDKAWAEMENEPEFADIMTPDKMVFDGKRMIYGGFVPVVNI